MSAACDEWPMNAVIVLTARFALNLSREETLRMQRREFVTLLGGSCRIIRFCGPSAARAQQANRARRVGALWPFAEGSAEAQSQFAAFRQGLHELGWGYVQLESRWGGGDVERIRTYAADLVALAPDVIFAYFNTQLAPLARATRTIPIVFVCVLLSCGRGLCCEPDAPGRQRHRLHAVRTDACRQVDGGPEGGRAGISRGSAC